MNFRISLNVFVVIVLKLSISGCVGYTEKKTKDAEILPNPIKVINDDRVIGLFTEKASDYYMKNGGTQVADYQKMLINDSCHVDILERNEKTLASSYLYNQSKNGIFIFGHMLNCGKCPDYHIMAASAFLVSKDGVCVTNYHVFKSLNLNEPLNYETAFVMNYHGDIFPVTEVIAGCKEDDLAVFKIDTRGKQLQPLPLGENQVPGAEIHVISHPDYRFYTYAKGNVGRSYVRKGTTSERQTITAEFARGSSGAPILDNRGNVVGIVAGTENIYYRPNGEIYQMTVKDIIPVGKLHQLIK